MKQICSPFEIRLSKSGPTQIELKQRNITVSQTIPYIQFSDADEEKSKNDESDALNFLNPDHSDPRKHVEIKHDYPAYRQTKLILSGDVEIQPGPKMYTYPPNTDAKSQEANNKQKHKPNPANLKETDISRQTSSKGPQKLHIPKLIAMLITTSTLILLIGICLYNMKATDHTPGPHTIHPSLKIPTNENLMLICNQLILKTKKNHIKISTRASYLLILLLLGGDIQQHPGPSNEFCLLCKQAENKIPSHTCDTCRGWCHISCDNRTSNPINSINTSYQWHCPNPNCLPNHQTARESTLKQKTNRYSPLNKAAKTKKNKMKTRNKKDNPLRQLPKIKSKDYIGREICKACHKTVRANHRAISCDKCERLTHQKCSDMSMKIYKSHENKDFQWVCNTGCRKPEDKDPATDIKKLKPNEVPILISDLEVTNEEFLILHYNCQSILNKTEELFRICLKLKPKIICLTETWLDDSTSHTAGIPDGYKLLRCDRSHVFKQKYGKTNGGGTAILYSDEIKVRKLNINTEDQETQWIEVKANQIFTLGLIYRAEYTDLLVEKEDGIPLEKQLCEASIRSKRIIVTGDFNCDVSAEVKDAATNRLEEMFERFSMKQHITKPTRISQKNTATTIDHIWADAAACSIKETGTIEEIGKSDHTGLYLKLNLTTEKPEPESIRYRNYRNYDAEAFNNDLKKELLNSDIESLIDNDELDKAMDSFTKTFKETAQKHAPMIEKTRKSKNENVPWFDKLLEMKIEEKNKKLTLYRLYGDKKDLKLANQIGNEITHLKRKLKKRYYKQKIEEYDGDSKKMWRILKDVTQTTPDKSTIEPDFLNQEKANAYNKYFATIGTVVQNLIGTKDATPTADNTGSFHFHEETEETIIKLIDRIRVDVATGADEISAKLIKDAKYTIAKLLSRLVNLSYLKSTFPSSMKIAIIKALHKKNCTEDISNYRPLSILSVLSKIFERSATDQIVKYLEENKLLNTTQHAYRKKHSTTTCLMEVIDYINTNKDKGKIVGVASLDLSKAFDSINHTHLLNKLAKFGLDSEAVKWCKSYLEERKQTTKFKKFTSSEHTVTSGVPQGSILGPILFIMFTNEMAEHFSNCKIMSYADDTQLIVTGNTTIQVKLKLEELIKLAQKWYTDNSLMNNASKTEILIIGNNSKDDSFILIEVEDGGKIKYLKPKQSIKILGVHIDNKLNWNNHIQAVRKKATNAIRNLHRINQLIPLKHRVLLYNSLVATHYNYADTVWSGCGVTNENKLQTTQNFAARSILGRKKRSSATEALKDLKFLSLRDKRKVHEAVYVHKALNDKLPASITAKYQNQISKQNLRSTSNLTLNIPIHKTQKYQQGPLYRTIKSWNNTSMETRTGLETNTFKKHYQTKLAAEI